VVPLLNVDAADKDLFSVHATSINKPRQENLTDTELTQIQKCVAHALDNNKFD
jgi:hypothetical protein